MKKNNEPEDDYIQDDPIPLYCYTGLRHHTRKHWNIPKPNAPRYAWVIRKKVSSQTSIRYWQLCHTTRIIMFCIPNISTY
jgi:hypothetical protein